MKKLLALLLALVMVLGCCACGAQTETETTETKTETTTAEKTETKEEPKEEEEKVEETEEQEMIHATAVVFSTPGFTPIDDAPMEDHYREYGLDLEIMPVDTGTDESWNIFWASGGYADIILPYTYKPELVSEGIVRTIEFDWIKDYMPRLYSGLLRMYGSEEEILSNLLIKGECYCVPYITQAGLVSHGTGFRNDWLEAVGLEAPTTVEEWAEVLRAFTEDDPDGNGVDDTYGASSNTGYGLFNIAAAFGTSSEYAFWYNDGEVTTNVMSEEYRDYLRTVSEWYQNGWVDPEGITDDRGTLRNKWATGVMGAYADGPWWWELERGEVGPLQMLCASQNFEYDTACSFVLGIESKITGEPVCLTNFWSAVGQTAAYFGYDCPDETVIRYMQMMDQSVVLKDHTEEDKAAQILWYTRRVGEEGVHWERDEDGWPRQIVPATAEESQANGWNYFGASHIDFTDVTLFEGREDEFVKDLYQQSFDLDSIARTNNVQLPALTQEMVDINVLCSDYFHTCRAAFMSGEMDIEADWDTYVATMEEYGINDLIAYYEAELAG